METINYI